MILMVCWIWEPMVYLIVKQGWSIKTQRDLSLTTTTLLCFLKLSIYGYCFSLFPSVDFYSRFLLLVSKVLRVKEMCFALFFFGGRGAFLPCIVDRDWWKISRMGGKVFLAIKIIWTNQINSKSQTADFCLKGRRPRQWMCKLARPRLAGSGSFCKQKQAWIQSNITC